MLLGLLAKIECVMEKGAGHPVQVSACNLPGGMQWTEHLQL